MHKPTFYSTVVAALLALASGGRGEAQEVVGADWASGTFGESYALTEAFATESSSAVPLQQVAWSGVNRGLIAGVEWTYLKPHFSNGVPQLVSSTFEVLDQGAFAIFDEIVIDDISWNYQGAPRVWLGVENAEGFGGRIVWWHFDHSTAVVPLIEDAGNQVIALGQHSIKAATLDMEATQRTNFRNWSVLGSAGIRYAEMTTVQSVAFPGSFFDAESQFTTKMSGIGPSLGAQVSRPILGGLSFFAQGRGSLIYGNGRERQQFDVEWLGGAVDEELLLITSRNDLMGIAEFRIGGEYIRPMANGNTLFLRSTFETQFWSGAIKNHDNWIDNSNGDIGFLGFTLGAGLGY